MANYPVHARFDGPIVMIGFGSIGRGTLPLLERHIAFDRSKFVVIDPVDTDRKLLDERKLKFIKVGLTKAQPPRGADPAAQGRAGARHDRQRLGRHLLGRPDGPLQGPRLPLHRHRRRAVAGLLRRSEAHAVAALELRAPRARARPAPQTPGRRHGGELLRRQPRHGVVVRQAGAARRRPRHRRHGRRAEVPRGLGAR